MAIDARAKGKRGEREVIALLQPIITTEYEALGLEAPQLRRNLSQTRGGGYDIEGVPWLALEVKNCSKDQRNSWWAQTLRQAEVGQEPLLMYKITGSDVGWRAMINGRVELPDGKRHLVCPIDISAGNALKLWLAFKIRQYTGNPYPE